MNLNPFGWSATLLTIASVSAIGLAPVKAFAALNTTESSTELAQRVGERPGDNCRMVVQPSILYTDMDTTSTQIANMLENEMVNFMHTRTAEDGTVWFHVEDSVGNVGFMPAYMSATNLANLRYCSAMPATFPATW